ncbi:coatomer subunit beta [Eurytemora carolleeae]|uniref:coatomer subunit beta n=1 Tax=Eurytemora carolleeae TaxID=1294199 RepID=UPI000C765A44|nr:coatomer subunit beta [Eurytemora carolleeae]|eukprot:XP_023319800.1 coatomer subunit beta-like [Eurytemora affinis]
MSLAELPCYTIINVPSDFETPNEIQLKNDLEKGDIKVKTEALKKIIYMILNGEKIQNMLMNIIRFVLPSQDHMIKKMLLIFWEIVPKTYPDGKLMQEMILVCDAYRKDLQHPNEFIRGSTLRFLCKLKEPELLEPLMPTIRSCLEHRHSYVRRNAVLAIFTIFKNFDFLIPDAPELIANFLDSEQDMSCKRNAFMMLIHADQDRALSFLSTCMDQVQNFGDILQLVIVELIYRVCHQNPSERSKFIRCIYNLLNSSSASVRYEAAGTLVTLSSAPTAVKAAVSAYIDLIVKESDNNVKLIVLDRLIAMKDVPSHEKVLQESVMDIMRVLASPDLEVRRKTLNIAMELVTSRNIEELVLILKKEISKTQGVVEQDDNGKYRQLLVRTLHSTCIKFPDVASSVIPLLMEFLSDNNELAAMDVLIFVREVMTRFSNLRPIIVEKLLESFSLISSVKIHRAALWILGEFCEKIEDMRTFMAEIRQSLGELPLVEDEMKKAAGEEPPGDEGVSSAPAGSTQRLVTADGTYATQSAFSSNPESVKKNTERPPLRKYLMEGDFFIGAALGSTLAKLALRFASLVQDEKKENKFNAECMFVITTIMHLGVSGLPEKKITKDDLDRLNLCLKVLSDRSSILVQVFTSECRDALEQMLEAQLQVETSGTKGEKKTVAVQPDSPINFLQLSKFDSLMGAGDVLDLSLSAALGTGKISNVDFATSKLNKVTQLTGLSDPVYSEAYVNVNQYDIVLDVLIVNQTRDTLQNCTLELATLGDLKLVEKPQPIVLAPNDFANIKANVKVASTENGIIFGNIVYDVKGAVSDRNVVVLNDIHIDIMDYIVPATCTETEFRSMWAEFEWENKVSVNTTLSNLSEYLASLLKNTNMKCLTPNKALSGECGFMAANLYAKSIFGEDALANVSLERNLSKPDAPVTGHIRIRAKSQGMALSLGDKINQSQKSRHKKPTVAQG